MPSCFPSEFYRGNCPLTLWLQDSLALEGSGVLEEFQTGLVWSRDIVAARRHYGKGKSNFS